MTNVFGLLFVDKKVNRNFGGEVPAEITAIEGSDSRHSVKSFAPLVSGEIR
jgi:hypothetical protein